MDARYRTSEELLERALRTIPLGSQTFSKSLTQFPRGVSPFFVTHGKGCRVWDADGNEYIDFINALAAVLLGYQDPDVNRAVHEQLDRGVTFSLAHPLEMEVAEKLVATIPCAEMVRFGKNGSDATAGVIRLARAQTGREHVAVCGYHGWQDWYIGSTLRHKGVPEPTRSLTHVFTYNDIASLEKLFAEWPNQIAAVILEPVNVTPPTDDFLQKVAKVTRQNGALLVFDETITGFRFALGGAQEYFGVTPDLATFGKGLANGLPLSAVVGRRDLMKEMEEIFFSFTFGGETLSLAAASATLDKLSREKVVPSLWQHGARLMELLAGRIERHGVGSFLSIGGYPVWSFLLVKDAGNVSQWSIRTLLFQELFQRGILFIGTHNLCYAHGDAEIDRLMEVYDEVFPLLRRAVLEGEMERLLRCAPIQPLFRVR
ncbi:MAG: aminotransferase class III-fold pyridoxal phosphate-dependent enzyme [Magnetococcales bacterium]|nr:aminotransferase class III-fold pyridoxal phosphate-dependent enzyme [Magnetococcales bacterium]